MGISTAPDEFQAVMNPVLGGLSFVRVYLDDVLIVSTTFKEYMMHLRMVLARVQNAGVIIHPKKSKFCVRAIDYLGYHISTDGIQPMGIKCKRL